MTTYADDVDCHKILMETQIIGQPIVAKMKLASPFPAFTKFVGSGDSFGAISNSKIFHCATGYTSADKDACQAIMAAVVARGPYVSAGAIGTYGNTPRKGGFVGLNVGGELVIKPTMRPSNLTGDPTWVMQYDGRMGVALIKGQLDKISFLQFDGDVILDLPAGSLGGSCSYDPIGNWGSYDIIKLDIETLPPSYYSCGIIGILGNKTVRRLGYLKFWDEINTHSGSIIDVVHQQLYTHFAFVLCDDKRVYVYKSDSWPGMDVVASWTGVIKICGGGGMHTLIGLKDDGTVYFAGYDNYMTPGPCKPDVEGWTDIVDVALLHVEPMANLSRCIVVGVKSNGSVVVAGHAKHFPVWQWVQTWDLNS